MIAIPILLFVVPGVLLVLLALARPKDPEVRLPPAKLENGKPLVWPKPPRGFRIGQVLVGLCMIAFGVVISVVINGFGGLSYTMGRPVRIRGRVRLPRRARGAGGHDDAQPRLAGLGLWRRIRLGARWHAAARTEYASIPAFERLGTQLRVHGAPLELIDRCAIAARDEDRHAQRCYALARAYSGVPWRAGALPVAETATPSLEALAVESLIDGCIGEAIAAEVARRGAEREADPVIAQTLAMIAAEETQHAELAWSVIAFCCERGGARVATAIANTARDHAPHASAGPTALERAECAAIAASVVSATRSRVAAMESC